MDARNSGSGSSLISSIVGCGLRKPQSIAFFHRPAMEASPPNDGTTTAFFSLFPLLALLVQFSAVLLHFDTMLNAQKKESVACERMRQ